MFPKERYDPDSFTPTGNCKIIWTNFERTRSPNSAAMDEFNDNEIAKLLRLKRYEQPPPGYFENFLHEFHRRQRDELLRQPLWRICLDRAHDFMVGLNLPALTSHPAAVAAVLVCAAVISLKVYQTPAPGGPVAEDRSALTRQTRQVFVAPGPSVDAEWTLASPVATRFF